MAGDEVLLGSCKTTVFLQNDSLSPTCEPLRLPTSTSAPNLHGAKSAGDFESVAGEETSVKEESGDHEELLDVCLNQSTKKRRLTADQVQYLEKNFVVHNKLEPERKLQFARELGLPPRQVAIWFQNRRARFKNKQLEKDYDSLKVSYEKLKAGYESLVKEKESLENEVISLNKKVLNREKGMDHLQPRDTINPSRVSIREAICEKVSEVPMVITPKQEAASSAKSDVFDSDSPTVSLLEPGDSTQALEPVQSEFSQDEKDNPGRTYFLSSSFFSGKLYPDAPSANSCNFEFPAVEDQPFWTWTY